jgi:Domain of unknown function (DUF4145)
MKCPHCLTCFHDNVERTNIGEDKSSYWQLFKRVCPECGSYILSLFEHYDRYNTASSTAYHSSREFLCYPKAQSRTPLPQEVPESYASDYREACMTLLDSSKASAALSRRCLQHLLREETNVKHRNLADEIQQVLDAAKLPSHLLDSLDAVRNIGNFAAHPIKSKASGEIIDVETGEAEWNLDVLESLFDYFFVQPAILKKKRDALNVKLKPELK